MKKYSNTLITVYTIFIVLVAIIEFRWDMSWTNWIAMTVFYMVFFGFTYLVCMNLHRVDRRLELVPYILVIASVFLSGHFLILGSSVVVTFLSLKHIDYTSKIVLIFGLIYLVSIATIFDVVSNDFITEKKPIEYVSPNEKYVVEDVIVDTNGSGLLFRVYMHRDVLGVIDLKYKVVRNKSRAVVEWVDDRHFTINGDAYEVEFW